MPEALLQVGRYRLIRAIASGGAGRVYEARFELSPGQEHACAIKLLRDSRAHDQTASQRFVSEAITGYKLTHDHPNLVTTLDVGTLPDGRIYIVMELIDGPTLEDVLEHRDLDTAEVRAIARAVLRALRHLHRHGVAHGDVTSSNILFCPDGVIKLADLGRVDTGSPEDDMCALGAVLYRLVTGMSAFLAAGQGAIPPMPDTTPPDVQQLIVGLLELEPDRGLPIDDALALLRHSDEPIADDEQFAALVAAGQASRVMPCDDERDDGGEAALTELLGALLHQMERAGRAGDAQPDDAVGSDSARPLVRRWAPVAALAALVTLLIGDCVLPGQQRRTTSGPRWSSPIASPVLAAPTHVGAQAPACFADTPAQLDSAPDRQAHPATAIERRAQRRVRSAPRAKPAGSSPTQRSSRFRRATRRTPADSASPHDSRFHRARSAGAPRTAAPGPCDTCGL